MRAWTEADYVEADSRYLRPAEVDNLCADASKARGVLGWEPTVAFEELVRIMVDGDLAGVERTLNGGIEAVKARAHSASQS